MRFSINIIKGCFEQLHKLERLNLSSFLLTQWVRRWVCLFWLLFTSLQTIAQSKISFDTLQNDLKGALQFLADTQCKETIEGKTYIGEWPAYMQMYKRFVLLGTRQKYRDSNSFTTSGIYNLLSEMYLTDTSLTQILPMLRASFPEIQSYATEQRYNFWKLLPPNRDLQKGPQPSYVPWVRRPTHYKLRSRYINNAANVENDADDTASGNLARLYHRQIFEKKTTLPVVNDSLSDFSDASERRLAPFQLFDTYLDTLRKNRHWYNYLFNGCAHSGAYMTWLGQEAAFKKWSIVKTFGHNQIFYLKQSICYPKPYRPYIPYGTNDVDAVVNANVLTYLAQNGELVLSKGTSGAHRFIYHQALRKRWSRAGHYYPNRYHFHYAVSRALAAGDTALLPTARLMLQHLMESQRQAGSYRSRRRVNHGDELQSTTYALLALLNFKKIGLNVPHSTFNRAVNFLRSQRQCVDSKVFWKGGVYFSGGTVVRNVLYFTSDAYTTALVAQALQKYIMQENLSQSITGRD
ncbi:hypothetical protein GVN20_07490 [Runella sp. CRIBMP]|uniref:hypothetical protein n=1 Tax=Runella sp. CRIBMP TaxID=2683261 RepID=UPI0014128839|nr:hypothetical protein [Runella sp. CRIBMP]NBB19193.1 hypothetical protein [Runella sp. CRIBMP]